MADLLSLPAFASRTDVHVGVETPRHAQAKFKYEPELGVFMLSRALTLGLSYPYDWGFVPSTEPPDGDPIDALVLHNITTSPGVVLKCRPIGILDVLQIKDQRTLRNDRLMMVPINSRHPDPPPTCAICRPPCASRPKSFSQQPRLEPASASSSWDGGAQRPRSPR